MPPALEGRGCMWIFLDDEAFAERGVPSMRCIKPAAWFWGTSLAHPRTYCMEHGWLIAQRTPRFERKPKCPIGY